MHVDSVLRYSLIRCSGSQNLGQFKQKRFSDNRQQLNHSCLRTCETRFIFDEKCAHFNALYYANALYVFLGFSLFHSRSISEL